MTDHNWISELGIHYPLGVDGLNLFLIAADDACSGCAATIVAAVREWDRPRLFYL